MACPTWRRSRFASLFCSKDCLRTLKLIAANAVRCGATFYFGIRLAADRIPRRRTFRYANCERLAPDRRDAPRPHTGSADPGRERSRETLRLRLAGLANAKPRKPDSQPMDERPSRKDRPLAPEGDVAGAGAGSGDPTPRVEHPAVQRFDSNCLVISTSSLTASTEWSNIACSSAVNSISTIFSTPPAPRITGTPT